MPILSAHDYPIWTNAGLFLAAAVLVWVAGTRLTGYLDAISQKTGLGQAFVGMLLLGGITSLPELANAINASWIGNPALSINNLLGSAAVNVLLLAVADAVVEPRALTSVVARPSILMMATMCMLVLIAIALAIAAGDLLIGFVGAWSVGLCALCVASFWLAVRYGDRAPWRLRDVETPRRRREETAEPTATSLRRLVARTIFAGIIIFAAGYTLSETGDALAKQTGLGSGLVGFLLIGISTSMPELSTITAALRIHRYEMAFGQILGTNFINLSLILVADLVFVGGPVINELGRFEIISALLGAILVGVFLVGLLERRNPVFMRMGYDSLAVMVLFAGGVCLLYTAA